MNRLLRLSHIGKPATAGSFKKGKEHPRWKGGKSTIYDRTKKYLLSFYAHYPWKRVYKRIQNRCRYNKESSYYGRVKNLITIDELKFLWFRDKAYLMKEPSIDREDSRGHYVIGNCRFIEMEENKKRRKISCQT